MVAELGESALARDVLTERVIASAGSASAASVRRRVDELLQRDMSFALLADGVVYVPALVEGTTWTAFVDADDAAQGFLRTHPQLSPLGWWLIADDVELVDADGAVLGGLTTDGIWLDGADTDVVYGPEGWLNDVAGGWAAVSVRAGALHISRLDTPPSPTERQAAATRAGFERAASVRDATLFDGEEAALEFTSGDRPILEGLVQDRDAFIAAQIPVLSDLYAAAGLEVRGHNIAAKGFDWDALSAWQQRNRAKAFYGLGEREVDALTMLIGACGLYSDDGDEALGPDEDQRDGGAILLSALLEAGDVGVAFWEEAKFRQISIDEIVAFTDALAARMEGVPLPGLAWIRSRCLEETGAVADAVAMLEAAVDSRCEHVPALVALAGFASDRGDGVAAWRWLRQAGVIDPDGVDDDDEFDDDVRQLIHEVEQFATRPRPSAGRNDPCPCGSGRKYKACHLGKELYPLADRSGWLYLKATRFLRRFEDGTADDVATAMTIDAPWHRQDMLRSHFVIDVVLHEHGLFDEFLEERGSLLPADEAILAAKWTLVDRSVFEVTGIAGPTLDLYDLGRGENIHIVKVVPSDAIRIGMVVVGRPLPVGEEYRAFSGFLPVPHHFVEPMLDAIADGDPHAIEEVVAALLRPPGAQNTDGDELVLHTMHWSLPAGADVAAALTAAGFESDHGRSWRLTADTKNHDDTLVLAVEFDPDAMTLTGEVNSDERAERLAAIVADVLPGSELVDDHRREFHEALDSIDPLEESEPALDSPELREAIDEMMIAHERRWVDESIPALGGRTPRDAITDPIGREQVRQLLASFPEPPLGHVGGMRASRLRALLGLQD
jgi:hypothetical protein